MAEFGYIFSGNDRFVVIDVPEGFVSPGCSCGNCDAGAGELYYAWLMDRELQVRIPFHSVEDAIAYAEEFVAACL